VERGITEGLQLEHEGVFEAVELGGLFENLGKDHNFHPTLFFKKRKCIPQALPFLLLMWHNFFQKVGSRVYIAVKCKF
jgi:hypothetical protein